MTQREEIWQGLGLTCKNDGWYDSKNRLLLKQKGRSLVLSRVPDLDEEIKKEIARFYAFNTRTPLKEVYDFLNFQEEEEAFCS